ncbi:hypothetical protein XBP1_760002 [Xenorhabdus bovienii str. puntauvense]|uniref:Transposase n=1 Tax=Xenorhabdus bovienii str. puntauvense TaxID=1398201 RepID=A0A077NK77_XENBV|nr:hypothetical protein XBP1_760002 [Xenorhabdus bovienii str. puntauvense]
MLKKGTKVPEARSKFLLKKTKSWKSSGRVNLEEFYCCVDDCCQTFIPLWHQQLIENGLLKRHREASLSLSEVMMIRFSCNKQSLGNISLIC